MNNPSYAIADFFATTTRFVEGVPITQTRPNNVAAYAAGHVYGDAGDARWAFAAPALPADAFFPGYNTVGLFLVQSRLSSDPATTFNVLLCDGAFTTVIGDAGSLTLADAEIPRLLPTTTFGVTLAALGGAGTNSPLNMNAALAARRGLSVLVSPFSGFYIRPSATLGMYLVLNVAYTPVALETLTVTPIFGYGARER